MKAFTAEGQAGRGAASQIVDEIVDYDSAPENRRYPVGVRSDF